MPDVLREHRVDGLTGPFRKATYSPFDCEHSTSELAESSTVGSVAICKAEEEFSWLTPLKHGTGSGSDRMPAFNVLLRMFLID